MLLKKASGAPVKSMRAIATPRLRGIYGDDGLIDLAITILVVDEGRSVGTNISAAVRPGEDSRPAWKRKRWPPWGAARYGTPPTADQPWAEFRPRWTGQQADRANGERE